jgi:hypothetical protein
MPIIAVFLEDHWLDLLNGFGVIVSLFLSYRAFRVSATSDERSHKLELSERRILIGEKHVAAEKIMRNFPSETAEALALWKLDFARRGVLDSSMWRTKQTESEALLGRAHELRLQYSCFVADLEAQDSLELERRVIKMAEALAMAEGLQASISRPAP